MTKVVGIIPARGGSKGIPRKNIRPLAGIPLIAYSINAAKKSDLIDRVVVSTDDPDIANVARSYGADVPFVRPSHLAADDTPDWPVFYHCLSMLRDLDGYKPTIVVHLRPTSPFRNPNQLDHAILKLIDAPSLDSVRAVCLASHHPLKMWTMDESGLLYPFVNERICNFEEPYNQPRQGLPKVFVQTNSIDVVRSTVIYDLRSMTGRNIGAYLIEDPKLCVDTDSQFDWEMAELMAEEAKYSVLL